MCMTFDSTRQRLITKLKRLLTNTKRLDVNYLVVVDTRTTVAYCCATFLSTSSSEA